MLLYLNRFSFASFRKEAATLLSLAWPMLLAQVAQVGVGFVDTVMAGNAGKEDLAAVGLGTSVFVMVYITLLGIMSAINPLISQKHGAGETLEVGALGRQGLWFGVFWGVVGMLLMWALIVPMTGHLKLTPYMHQQFVLYVASIALAMPAAMVHRALHAYASGLGRPKPIMWVSWAALFLNVPLNYVFVYGKWGMPALGGAGCGVASALVFWFNAVALWLYVAKSHYFARFGLMRCWSWPDWGLMRQMCRLGLPIGLSFFLEVSLFTFMMLLLGRMDGNTADYVAAQQVVMNFTSLIYMIPQSVGTAAMVRVAFSLGAVEPVRARYVSGVAVALGVVLALLTAAAILLWRHEVVALYSKDAAVLALGASVLLFAVVFQVFDSIQCIASYALRGYKVTRLPMVIHALAFWVIGLGLGCVLAFWADWKIYGFWTAVVLALLCAALALLWCLEKVSLERAVR